MRWLLCATILVGVSSCFVDVNHGATSYTCVESPICPEGYLCEAGLCVENVPGEADASPDPDAAVAALVRGDVLYYSFDDYDTSDLAHDRSGHRFDSEVRGATLVDGRFGRALQFDSDEIDVLDRSALFLGSTITIEAYVLHLIGQEDAAIYGDENINQETNGVEYALGLDIEDHLEFRTNSGCDTAMVSFKSTGTVTTGEWHHVAVAWNGSEIVFYIDGVESGRAANVNTPCQSINPRSYRIGRRRGGTGAFSGVLDEIKVSGVAKSAFDIQRSMAHDSALNDIGRCGDNVIDTEICETGNACCTDSCQAEPADTSCGTEGVCNASAACTIAGGRVIDALQVLYEFNEGAGVTVGDTSGVGLPLDLTISDELAVTWAPAVLSVDSPVIISSIVAAQKIVDAVKVSNEVTVEAWIESANDTQDGPARIVTLSPDTGQRNVTLGQQDEVYLVRMRSQQASAGEPVVDTPVNDVVVAGLTHLLVTRAQDGVRRLYVNGVQRSLNSVGGDLSNWGDFPLTLANEVTGNRLWRGTLHLAAVYSRALTSDDVARNFAAGPD